MAARRGINLVPSLLRAADLSLQRAACSRSILPAIYNEGAAFRPIAPVRSLWSGWNSGFSSSSALQQGDKDDGKTEAPPTTDGASAAAADGGASSDEETEQKLSPEELQSALNECQENLEAEKKKADDFKDKLMRTLADMENLRERTARQTQEAKQFAVQGFLKSLVDVADNLERAAGSVALEDVDGTNEIELDRAVKLLKSLRDGVILTDNILMKILEKEGVSRYDPMGDAFDPNLHMALFQVPDATKDPGTVAVVVKKGYLLHDRPVRAAEVGVATAVSQAED